MTSRYTLALHQLRRRIKRISKPLYRHPAIAFARLKRRKLSAATIVAITGSSGKTTTKDLIYELLRENRKAVKSDDTNNQIYSVARTLMQASSDTQFVVQEIGLSATNDMNKSLRLLRPTIGVVTNIGLEHFKKYRSKEMVAAEKSKLVRCLPPDGIAILNGDDEYLRQFVDITRASIFMYGFAEGCDLQAVDISSAWPRRLSLTLRFSGRQHSVQTQFCGEHLAYSVLAALATSLALGVKIESAIARIEKCSPTLGRMSPHETASGIQFIRDDWKAPYWSIQSSIEFMRHATAPRKVIVIGTISDMSGSTSRKYRNVAEHALEAADVVYFFGPNSSKALLARSIPEGKALRAYTDFRELADHLKGFLIKGDLVLVKGSGSDHLARLVIQFDHALACWRQRCGLENMCDVCERVS